MASSNHNNFRRHDSWVQREIDALPRGQKTKTFYRALGEHFMRQSMPDAGLLLMEKMYGEIHRAAVNINQISRHVNTHASEDIQVTHEDLRNALDEMKVLKKGLEKVLNHWTLR